MTNSPTNIQDNKSLAMSRAVRELGFSLYAVLLTIIFGLVVYFNIPWVQSKFQNKTNINILAGYQRTYTYTNNGVIISLKSIGNISDKNNINRLKIDQEILSRRFQNGIFTIVSLSGLSSTEVYNEIIKYKSLYKFEIITESDRVDLKINLKNNNNNALQALHKYFKYIEKNWHKTNN